MDFSVQTTHDAQRVLDSAGEFLAEDPVRHNVILTLLMSRTESAEPGNYWIVGDSPVGVVFQSPTDFVATMTPMPEEAVTSAVREIVGRRFDLPGVSGEAATAARFAGDWTEATKSAAVPVEGFRIYEVTGVRAPAPPKGSFRQASSGDRDGLVDWVAAFQAETGEGVRVATRLSISDAATTHRTSRSAKGSSS